MRIAVCDDAVQQADQVRSFVQKYFNKNCIVDVFHSGAQFLRSKFDYEIAFLDIDLGDVSGINLAKYIRERNTSMIIIFVTNYADYYKHAFSVHAFDYLIKPVTWEKISNLLNEIASYRLTDKQEKYVRLKGENGIVQLRVNQIYYFEYSERKVKVVTNKGEMFLNYALHELEKLFQDYEFQKPHRAFLVNLRRIKGIMKYDIVLDNGATIPLAQRKAAAFKRKFEIYLYHKI